MIEKIVMFTYFMIKEQAIKINMLFKEERRYLGDGLLWIWDIISF